MSTVPHINAARGLALGEAPRGERKPRVVVTGGSGKLGRATISHLSSQGWEVIK